MKQWAGTLQLKIKILGTGTAVPSLQRLSSSYLVTCNNTRILVDVGPSVVRRLLESGYQVDDVDVVVLTHFHVDHTADLSTFLFACNYGERERRKALTIIGGPGILKFLRDLKRLYPWVAPKSYALSVRNPVRQKLSMAGFNIETARVRHNRESVAVKIDCGKSIVFSGDTGYSRTLVRLATDADLFVAECSFPERKAKGHMNLALLHSVVEESGAKKVIISHRYPEWNDFEGTLRPGYVLGEDGMELEV